MTIETKAELPPASTAEPSLPRTAADWLALFGPGAVIASLTIGAGELIFSSRSGAIFGYRLLWFFAAILLLKWALVIATARHMILTGAHPFERWLDLPGPRGWLPSVFFVLALLCFPIWVAFHAGTTGTLIAALTDTQRIAHGAGNYLWGIVLLAFMLGMAFTGGYSRLEKIQLAVTLLMLAAVVISVILLKPDWIELLKGLLLPQRVAYPDWLLANPEFARRPVWVETVTYVGIVGGSGYDYLAYVSYLRDKQWGQAGKAIAAPAELEEMNSNRAHPNRQWLRAVWIDSTLSFAAVFMFAAVFVICGAVVLQPQHKVPSGSDLLTLQAEFVTPVYPWLKLVYFLGALLAMTGTLYGTIEVAPTVLREMGLAIRPARARGRQPQLRRWALWWVCVGGLVILTLSALYRVLGFGSQPPGLIALVTPANLFTGVLACGIVCWSVLWMDRRFLPPGLRMHPLLMLLNFIAGIVFVGLGIKGYWDHSGETAFGLLALTILVGFFVAGRLRVQRHP